MLFEGRVMMVTGGGGGIGRATSLMAAKEGRQHRLRRHQRG